VGNITNRLGTISLSKGAYSVRWDCASFIFAQAD